MLPKCSGLRVCRSPFTRFDRSRGLPTSFASGVGHEPKALSDVRRFDARSAQIRRPDGEVLRFQVSRNRIEPRESIRARNLLSKHDWRAALADEPKPRRPEMTGIFEALAFAGAAEGLAGARARPNRSVIGPTGESEGIRPSSDPGEEVALGEASQILRLDELDVSLVNVAWGDEPLGDEPSEPLGREGLVLVVVGRPIHPPCLFPKIGFPLPRMTRTSMP